MTRKSAPIGDLRMSIGRASVSLVDDAGEVQSLQLEVLDDEVLDDVERHQDYGFASAPHPGASAVILAVAGNRRQSLAVAVGDRRYRLTGLEAGEVAIHDDQGQKIHLTRTGIVIETDLDVTVTTGGAVTFNATGDVAVNSDGKAVVTAGGDAEVNAGGDALITGVGKATVQAPQVIVDSADVLLGGSGAIKKVALVGDSVSGGVITGPGATRVKAL